MRILKNEKKNINKALKREIHFRYGTTVGTQMGVQGIAKCRVTKFGRGANTERGQSEQGKFRKLKAFIHQNNE